MQADDAQPTPESCPSVVAGGIGTFSRRHSRPFQISTSGRLPPDFAPKYGAGTSWAPTDTQCVSVAHDSDKRKLLPFSIGGVGDCASHDPAEWIAYGTRIV